ncbi:MAG: hypothetical protein JXB15_14800 [Anaerolineales bacterium]|nr:hypothetical protein [Anaerolineales bacterium]
MNENALNLKELEKLAYRRTYQDGLYDIYIGGLLASFAAFGFMIFPGSDQESIVILLYYLIGMGLSGLVFWLGKKYITLPRIGLVNFGPARQKHNRDLILPLVVITAVQALVVLLQFGHFLPPALRSQLTPILGAIGSPRLMVAIFAVIFVAPGMLLVAFLRDSPRGYYHAVVMSLAIFLMILLDQAWWMVLGGALIFLPGVFQLARFLRQYPLEDVPDGQS